MIPFQDLNKHRRLFQAADIVAAAWIAVKRFTVAFILSVVFLGMGVVGLLFLNELLNYWR